MHCTVQHNNDTLMTSQNLCWKKQRVWPRQEFLRQKTTGMHACTTSYSWHSQCHHCFYWCQHTKLKIKMTRTPPTVDRRADAAANRGKPQNRARIDKFIFLTFFDFLFSLSLLLFIFCCPCSNSRRWWWWWWWWISPPMVVGVILRLCYLEALPSS